MLQVVEAQLTERLLPTPKYPAFLTDHWPTFLNLDFTVGCRYRQDEIKEKRPGMAKFLYENWSHEADIVPYHLLHGQRDREPYWPVAVVG